jgi:hypothetical protein
MVACSGINNFPVRLKNLNGRQDVFDLIQIVSFLGFPVRGPQAFSYHRLTFLKTFKLGLCQRLFWVLPEFHGSLHFLFRNMQTIFFSRLRSAISLRTH